MAQNTLDYPQTVRTGTVDTLHDIEVPAPVLIRVEVDAGHGLGKPASKLIEEMADQWAFAFHHLEMDLP